MLYVGNDIVDLCEDEVRDRHLDGRFVNRILEDSEKRFLSQTAQPLVMLWALWAAKETAYKIISKLSASILFSPKKFVVTQVQEEDFRILNLQVRYGEAVLSVNAECRNNRIHAAGFLNEALPEQKDHYACQVRNIEPSLGIYGSLEGYFTESERLSIQSAESAQARYFSKIDLSRQWDVPLEALTIVRLPRENGRWGPPEVYVNHKKSSIDISFSHHGKWLAWIWSLPVP